ncbi:hypothetical protein BK816_08355 [Boudabousia tangfeifanii]|uniref:Major facilitator superfamily (MFS) profile domain-containing protein n=1 Tax=Boudabousia tangfeifanii TaxID=1912795 RepID=A0A1D9MMN2_9ACTO|nr:MFS transporter [Boudabousia tangfeifanii]AOZ73566.1 hypothetical protein BK816_08355 [Boudabousia tangfeifanii]
MNANEAKKPAGKSKIFTWPVVAWSLWDFGSAAFNAVVTTFVFSTYLTSDQMFTDSDTAQKLLSQGLTIAGIVIALLAPITGQRADRRGKGTFLLGLNTFAVVGCMVAMFWVHPDSALGPLGALWLGIILMGLGNIFFEFASVNYNAMLGRISKPENMGTISGIGWGSGYFGGILLLGLLLVGFLGDGAHWFGVPNDNHLPIRASILFSALWFGACALPVLFTIRGRKYESSEAGADDGHETIIDSYRFLGRTIKSLFKEAPQTLLFLAASAIFRDGLAGVFMYGAIIGRSVFGFDQGQIMIFAILANVVAGIATWAFGWIEDRIGPKKVIIISLVSMITCGFIVFFAHNGGQIIFWTVGLVLTAFVGPAQSASRAFLGRMIPEGREGEVFGLYATTGRAVSFLAPAMYFVSLQVGEALTGLEKGYDYWGILGIVLILFLGLLILIPVKPERAHLNH